MSGAATIARVAKNLRPVAEYAANRDVRPATEPQSMKLGVFTVLFGDQPLEAALDRPVEAGLDCVEIGTGNDPGDRHCRPAEPVEPAVGDTRWA